MTHASPSDLTFHFDDSFIIGRDNEVRVANLTPYIKNQTTMPKMELDAEAVMSSSHERKSNENEKENVSGNLRSGNAGFSSHSSQRSNSEAFNYRLTNINDINAEIGLGEDTVQFTISTNKNLEGGRGSRNGTSSTEALNIVNASCKPEGSAVVDSTSANLTQAATNLKMLLIGNPMVLAPKPSDREKGDSITSSNKETIPLSPNDAVCHGAEANRDAVDEVTVQHARLFAHTRDQLTAPSLTGYIQASTATSVLSSPSTMRNNQDGLNSLQDLDLANLSMTTIPLLEREEEPICPTLNLNLPLPQGSADIRRILATVGSSLLSVGSVVGLQAADAAVVVGAAVGVQAERVLMNTAQIVPRFNNQEMGQVIMRKNALLDELSQSCMRLGMMEDREKETANLIRELHLKESELQERQLAELTRANSLQCQLDDMRLSALHSSTVNQELTRQLALIQSVTLSRLDEVRATCDRQAAQQQHSHESEEKLKGLLDRQTTDTEAYRLMSEQDLAAVRGELEAMHRDQQELRREMHQAAELAVEQLTGTYGLFPSSLPHMTRSF